MEIHRYFCNIWTKKNGDARVVFTQRWWRHTRYLCDIHTKTVPLRDSSAQKKRQKDVAVHKTRVMYELKRNKEVCSVWKKKRKNVVSQSHKIKRDNSTGKLKDMCGSQHMEKRSWHSPRRKKICFRQPMAVSIVTNKYKWNSLFWFHWKSWRYYF